MKDAKKRIFLSLLLALVLMLGGISLCLKPICAKLIRDNGIGRAVALRINDVLYEHFPQTISIDNAAEIQNRMEKHPALAKISVKYLDAFANGTFSAEFPDTSAEYDVFNEEILDDLETALGFPLDLSVRQTMEQELREKEAVVADMLFSLFSSFDRHFGRFASIALRLYGSYTSLPFRIALALIALLLIRLHRSMLHCRRTDPGSVSAVCAFYRRLHPDESPDRPDCRGSRFSPLYSRRTASFDRPFALLSGWQTVFSSCGCVRPPKSVKYKCVLFRRGPKGDDFENLYAGIYSGTV